MHTTLQGVRLGIRPIRSATVRHGEMDTRSTEKRARLLLGRIERQTVSGSTSIRGFATQTMPISGNDALWKMKGGGDQEGVSPRGKSGPEAIIERVLHDVFGAENVITSNRSTLRNPLTGYPLELDFHMPEVRIAVEFQGPTHTQNVFGEEKRQRTLRNDQLKRELCRQQSILLVEVMVDSVHIYRSKNPVDAIERLVLFALRGVL